MGRRATEFRGTDRFIVNRRIGAGGMGVVYDAHDRERNTRVALKTVRTLSADAILRFKNEFRSLQDLEHPNLVSFGELFEASGQWFFTMEFVEGVDLLTYVRAREIIDNAAVAPSRSSHAADLSAVSASAATLVATADEAIPCTTHVPAMHAPIMPFIPCVESRLREVLGQLPLALAALHESQKVHRDIKPANILVTNQGRVVLLDFGLITGHSIQHIDDSAKVVGTAAYMAPEQAASQPVGPEADWYSVGVLLYEALTGQLPFSGTALEVAIAKQKHEPRPPSDLVATVPPDLNTLCVELLRRDPKQRPSGREVLRRLGICRPATARITPPTNTQRATPFVGRSAELCLLRQAFVDACSGVAVTVYVHGESGVGKSELVRRFVDDEMTHDDHILALHGRCYERESVPFKAFDGLVDALANQMTRMPADEAAALLPLRGCYLPQLFPVLSRVDAIERVPREAVIIVDAQERRKRMFDALRELLTRIAQRRRLILCVDDFQWADEDSLLLLRALMQPPNPPRLLLLLTARTTAENPSGRASIVERAAAIPGDIRHIQLKKLAKEQSRQLVELLSPHLADNVDAIARIAAEAEGHPLFIHELVRHHAEQRPSSNDMRLDEALWSRVSQLSSSARRLIEILAVAGVPIAQETAAQAAALSYHDLQRVTSLLRVASLARTSGAKRRDTVEPYHDRVREAVLRHLSADQRRHHHHNLALALEQAGAAQCDPQILVRHFAAAGQLAEAAYHARKAAARANRASAFDQAAELLRVALRLGQHSDEENRRLQMQLGTSLANAGRGQEAADTFLAAAHNADPVSRIKCQRQAAEQYLISGHIAQGLEVLRALLADIGVGFPASPRGALASLLWQRLKLRLRGLAWVERDPSQVADEELIHSDVYKAVAHGLGMVDTIRGADFQARGLLFALRLGEPLRLARALSHEAGFLCSQGIKSIPRARRLIGEARLIAESTNNPEIWAWVHAEEGIAGFFGSQFSVAADAFLKSETLFREKTTGTTWELNTIRAFRLWNLAQTHLGEFAEFMRSFDDYVGDASRRGDRYAETTLRRSCNFIWLAQGDPDEAERDLGRTSWSPPEGSYHLQHWFGLRSRGEIALYRGTSAQVIDNCANEFAALGGSLLLRVQTVRAESRWLRGRLLVDAGLHAAHYLGEVRALSRRLLHEGAGYTTVWGLLLLAGVAARVDTPEAQVRACEVALTHAEAENMHFCVAALKHRLGQLVLGDAGEKLRRESDQWMKQQRIAQPEEMIATVLPGVRDSA